MKKVVSVVLVALMILGLSITAFAEQTGKIAVTNASEAKAGDTVTLVVSASGFNAAVPSMFITLEGLDDTKAELVSNKWLISGLIATSFDSKNNAAFLGATPITPEGDIFELVIKIKEDAAPGDIQVKLVVGQSKEATFPVEGGKITVVCNHVWNEGEVTTAATCTTKGVKTFTCKVCNQTKTEEVAVVAHTAGEPVVVAATCTAEGSKTVNCTVCGAEMSKEAIAKLGHTAGEPVVVAATCTAEGSKTVNCTVCGAEMSKEVIAKLAHTYGEWKPADAANHEQVCAACGDKKVAAHAWDNGKVTKPATTEAEGIKTFTCNDCGATKEEVIAKNPPMGDSMTTVVFLSTLALVAICGVVVASKKRENA